MVLYLVIIMFFNDFLKDFFFQFRKVVKKFSNLFSIQFNRFAHENLYKKVTKS